MPLDFQLTLVEKRDDRLTVGVSLCPGGEAVFLEGVAVEILSARRERVSPRLLLPISGELIGPLATQVELRTLDEIPPGSVVVGTAWSSTGQQEALCAADRWIGLEAHVRALHPVRIERGGEPFLDLLPEERAALSGRFPWLSRPTRGGCDVEPDGGVTTGELLDPVPPEELDDELEHFAAELGLDDEDTDWLRELLD